MTNTTPIRKEIIYTYDAPIDCEPYFHFEDFINEAVIKNRDVVLYFTTNGGAMHLAQNMVDVINNFKNNIKIIVTGYCYSAGMYIIANVNCPVEIKSATSGMIHFPNLDINTKNLKDEDSWDYFQMTTEKESIDEYLRNIKHIMNEKEISKIENGKEVWLNTERMRELIKTIPTKGE